MEDTIKVLIVDDEAHIRLLMKTVLQDSGAEVVGEASNGQEAVAAFNEAKPNLVLMDINMPVMDGISALEKIVEIDPDALVIMLTSLSNMESVQKCIEAGAGGYIRKDTPIHELAQAVKDAWQEYYQS